MDVRLVHVQDDEEITLGEFVPSPRRVEVGLVGPDERQWKVILLDADDTFDVIIQDPTGDRERIWSLVKDGVDAGLTTTDLDNEGNADGDHD